MEIIGDSAIDDSVIRDGGIWRHTEIDDETQIGAARRQVAIACAGAGVPDDLAARSMLVAVELATNLHKHARRGVLFVKATSAQTVDLVAIDHGPGMDLQQCFVDGFSTSQTHGNGLGAVRRLAAVFDAYTDPSGSVVFARIGVVPGLEYGSLAIPIRGESVSGDQWALRADQDGWTLVMADGLGHGPQAHAASAFVGPIAEIQTPPSLQLQRANDISRGTRGSAAAALRHRASDAVLEFASVGNVHCMVQRRDQSQVLPAQNGTVGGAFPTVKLQQVATEPRGLVVVHTDGLTARWSLDRYAGLRMRHPQVVCGVLFRDCNRQRDDATIVAIRS